MAQGSFDQAQARFSIQRDVMGNVIAEFSRDVALEEKVVLAMLPAEDNQPLEHFRWLVRGAAAFHKVDVVDHTQGAEPVWTRNAERE